MTGGGGIDKFVLNAHEANGDQITDFAAGDKIQFVGFGAGASLSHVSGTNNWQIHASDGHTETFTLTNGASLHAGDFSFQMFH